MANLLIIGRRIECHFGSIATRRRARFGQRTRAPLQTRKKKRLYIFFHCVQGQMKKRKRWAPVMHHVWVAWAIESSRPGVSRPRRRRSVGVCPVEVGTLATHRASTKARMPVIHGRGRKGARESRVDLHSASDCTDHLIYVQITLLKRSKQNHTRVKMKKNSVPNFTKFYVHNTPTQIAPTPFAAHRQVIKHSLNVKAMV